jgi:hypothetical protein
LLKDGAVMADCEFAINHPRHPAAPAPEMAGIDQLKRF